MDVEARYEYFLEKTGKPQVAADLTLAEATLEAAARPAEPPKPASSKSARNK